MPILPRFDPPAFVNDFTNEQQRDGWSDTVSDFFADGVEFNASFVGAQNAQFYHPLLVSTDEPHQEPCIDWPAFPRLVKDRFPGDATRAFETAETGPNARKRFQDEYLEWHVVRNAANKIIRVSFTCETTQYYDFLARTDRNKLLEIYKQLVDPAQANDVAIGDLIVNGRYQPENKWNTEHGAIHLIQPNNTLPAEVMIAAQACILRKRANGTPITDPSELINCAEFGEDGRASDPRIGAAVNARARSGDAISLRNPVALYITRFSNDGINRNGAPVPSFWRLVRGTAAPAGQTFGMGLHLVYEVPANAGFVVGDLRIGGDPIRFGGQLAEKVHVGLFALLSRQGSFQNEAFTCGAVPQPPLGGLAEESSARSARLARLAALPTRRAVRNEP
jgi:hypothetical protein